MSVQEYAELIEHLNHTKWWSAETREAHRWTWRDQMLARLVHLVSMQVLKKPIAMKDLMANHPDEHRSKDSLKDIEARIAKAAAAKRGKK